MAKRKKGEIVRPCWNCAAPVSFIRDGAVFAWMDKFGRHRCNNWKTSSLRPRDSFLETAVCDYCSNAFERKLTERWKKICIDCYVEERRGLQEYKETSTGWIAGENYKPSGLCKNCVPPWEDCLECPDRLQSA